MELLAKRKALGDLILWDDIRRGLKRESDMAYADAKAYHKAIHGPRGQSRVEDVGGEEMAGHIVLGDMTITLPDDKPPPVEKESFLRKLLPHVLTAGLTVAGLGALAWKFGLFGGADSPEPPPPPPQVVQPDEPSDVDTELGVRVDRD